jgi:hypothetical protein
MSKQFYLSPELPAVDKQQESDDNHIAGLDPLKADRLINQVPDMNRNRDVEALRRLCYELLPHPDKLDAFDYYEACAAMRDFGILLGSMKRHKQEPVEAVPELDYVLDVLGSKTGMPPRDTLLHYTSWNPEGFRRRTYTGTTDEDHLIESVRMSMNPLLKAIYEVQFLLTCPVDSPDFARHCAIVADCYQKVVGGVIHARKNVSTEYFANELRLYFDPINLHDKIYLGPGAVEMPMFVYDHLLWSSLVTDPMYNEFKETYVPYILPFLRDTYTQQRRQPALYDIVTEWAINQTYRTEEGMDSINGIARLGQLMKSFRAPHKKMADESYQKDKQQRAHGSGGYSTDILTHILQFSRLACDNLQEAVQHYKALPLKN